MVERAINGSAVRHLSSSPHSPVTDSQPVSHRQNTTHTIHTFLFIFQTLSRVSYLSLYQPQLIRKKGTSCSRVTPSTPASFTSHQSKRPTALLSADAARSKLTHEQLRTHKSAVHSSVNPRPVILNCPSKIHFLQLCSALHTESCVCLYKGIRKREISRKEWN